MAPNYEGDAWINSQVVPHSVSEIEDCAIAVDATYYLELCLDVLPGVEPLLPALGGMTAIRSRLAKDLDEWLAHRVTPFFIFDGQPLKGEDEVNVVRGRRANEKTDFAWELYFGGRADEAVQAFGAHTSAFRLQTLYPLLQSLLKERGLHFLVPPFNAAAQIAYFEMIDSDQCAGVMGSLELMLYPIKDSIIRMIDWDAKTISAVSKKHITKQLNVSESVFIDAFLMTGTRFLPQFPPLQDPSIIKNQPANVSDAVNMLRTQEKSVMFACTAFLDILKTHDPNWLDKYQKARMAVDHFIYIAENGEVKVHNFERLTNDHHEYLGFQLSSELYHYVSTGLISPRLLSWISHGRLYILPTLDGVASEEYKTLVSKQLVAVKQAALALVVPRLHRALGLKQISMKVWYDRNPTLILWDRDVREAMKDAFHQIETWNVKEAALKEHFPHFVPGSIASEVLALQKPAFADLTGVNTKEIPKGIQSADTIISICLWRFLHIRGYVNDQHRLTRWGSALATAMAAFEPTVKKYSPVPHLYEGVLVAFELLRFGLLNHRNRHDELRGLPMNGTEDDQTCLLLLSRCATLLKLRHQDIGYTGPLSKNLLAYRSLCSEIRSADRDLIEAIVASLFMFGQAKRERDDGWQLSHRLPFLHDPDVALGIAVKTYLDGVNPDDKPEEKAVKLQNFPKEFVPYALNFAEDLEIVCHFFDALHAGIKTLDNKDMPVGDRAMWDKAATYLAQRRQ